MCVCFFLEEKKRVHETVELTEKSEILNSERHKSFAAAELRVVNDERCY